MCLKQFSSLGACRVSTISCLKLPGAHQRGGSKGWPGGGDVPGAFPGMMSEYPYNNYISDSTSGDWYTMPAAPALSEGKGPPPPKRHIRGSVALDEVSWHT